MSQAEQTWKRVNDKLQQVLQQYQLLQKENEQLSKELAALQEKEELQRQKMDELMLKVTALQTATGQLDDAEKKELDKKLAQYVREIDRCIAMLSSG